jgi:hypothetical protein
VFGRHFSRRDLGEEMRERLTCHGVARAR